MLDAMNVLISREDIKFAKHNKEANILVWEMGDEA
jgi:hypothetical protein